MDNNYKYIKNISSGAFSICGLYKKSNKYFAIKTSIDNKTKDGILSNELREIISLLILKNHPNIIDLYEIFVNSESSLNLVYKYYPETLEDYLLRTSVFERLEYTPQFINQMLSILYYLYVNRIIHTDIKPSNILVFLNDDGLNIKLIDFGSSHIYDLTSKYSIITTYTHRAPEIFTYDRNYDYKVDIWSFGVILYKFITGNDILYPSKHFKSDDIDKLKDIYSFVSNFDNFNIDLKYKLFLSKILKIDPKERSDINNLILLYQNLFQIQIQKYNNTNYNKNSNIKSNDLILLNNYISNRLFNINLDNLTFGNLILNKLESLQDIDYITIWYLNYQFTHTDVEYTLQDFIYIFNSFYKKIFNKNDIHDNCFNILYLIDFNLF